MFHKRHFDHRLDLLELYLTVRDPGTAKAAEAYDGLRKLLINANRGTQIHLAHLAELHRVASAADSTEPVLAKLREFMNQVGLLAVDDVSSGEFFEITGGKGSTLVVDSPAYVSLDGAGGAILAMPGIAHHEDPNFGSAEIRWTQADQRRVDAKESHSTRIEGSGGPGEPDHGQVEGAK